MYEMAGLTESNIIVAIDKDEGLSSNSSVTARPRHTGGPELAEMSMK
jgi:hypothetical protein